MNTLSRIMRATNWKYAVGEVALIFVGITLALLANSWYENSQDRDEEREILHQILLSLKADVTAITDSRAEIEEKVKLMTSLQSHIRDGLPYMSDLDAAFRAILILEYARMNDAAFETLKFRGIDLVSNSALRSQLVNYYDTEQKLLARRNDFDIADVMSAEPYFKKHFIWDSTSLLMAPIDYESLLADQEFLNILALRIWAQKTHALNEYGRISSKAESLISTIENHLNELQ